MAQLKTGYQRSHVFLSARVPHLCLHCPLPHSLHTLCAPLLPMEHLLQLAWAEGDFETQLASALSVAIFTYGHLARSLQAEG